jgi:hypothetical protein
LPPLARGFVLRASRPRLGFALAFGCARRALSQHHSPSSHHHPDQHSPPECPFKPKNRTEDGEDVIVPYCLSSSRYSIFKFASFSSCFAPADHFVVTGLLAARHHWQSPFEALVRIPNPCTHHSLVPMYQPLPAAPHRSVSTPSASAGLRSPRSAAIRQCKSPRYTWRARPKRPGGGGMGAPRSLSLRFIDLPSPYCALFSNSCLGSCAARSPIIGLPMTQRGAWSRFAS